MSDLVLIITCIIKVKYIPKTLICLILLILNIFANEINNALV